ncbi:hypothetical protein CRUP_002641 [Coryphaenoides rupestris]|nr:hypothetical protein CRUP_002641 [Coryphaenoides rupestris]
MLRRRPCRRVRCLTSSRSPRTPTSSRATPSSCGAVPPPPCRYSSSATGNGCTRTSTPRRSTRTSTQFSSF